MNKELIIVFQDCFMCGSPENWSESAKHAAEAAKKAGVPYRKLSFATIEGREHCAKAIESGVGVMPFFTDGKTYASDIETVLDAMSEPKVAKIKMTKQKKAAKEPKDGDVSDS